MNEDLGIRIFPDIEESPVELTIINETGPGVPEWAKSVPGILGRIQGLREKSGKFGRIGLGLISEGIILSCCSILVGEHSLQTMNTVVAGVGLVTGAFAEGVAIGLRKEAESLETVVASRVLEGMMKE